MRKAHLAILLSVIFILGFVTGVFAQTYMASLGAGQARRSETTVTVLKTVTVQSQVKASHSYEVYFSPKGGCEEALLYWIGRANSSIHIMIYSFTLDSLGEALISAHSRGVEVKVIMEEGQVSRYSEYEKLKKAGISVRLDGNPALMHNKVAIIDGLILITGSYNWSKSAETRNNENLIIIMDEEIAKLYEEEFAKLWRQSPE